MKITSIQSLAGGVVTKQILSENDDAIINLDDSSDESEVEIENLDPKSRLRKSHDDTEPRSDEVWELDSPQSPDPAIEYPKSPCVQIPLTTNEKIPSVEWEDGSPVILESPTSSGATNNAKESPTSPDETRKNDIESPASPDEKGNDIKSPASPDGKGNDMESPASPDEKGNDMESPASPVETKSYVKSPANPVVTRNNVDSPASPEETWEPPASSDAIGYKLQSEMPANPVPTDSAGSCTKIQAETGEEMEDRINAVPFSLDSNYVATVGVGGISEFRSIAEQKTSPLYLVDRDTVLGDTSNVGTNKDKDTRMTYNISCFNCLGNHLLKDCTNKLNFALINKRGNEFRKCYGGKEARYHEHGEPLEVKYSQVKPGRISTELRTIMGLRPDELPEYIYKMREHGYPPGWLSHATDFASSLKFYGGDAVRRTKPQAEVLKSIRDNLIEYPGFTTPVPTNSRDFGNRGGTSFSKEYNLDEIVQKYVKSTRAKIPAAKKGSSQLPSEWKINDPRRTSEQNPQNKEPSWFNNSCAPPLPVTTRSARSDLEVVQKIYQSNNTFNKKNFGTSVMVMTRPSLLRPVSNLNLYDTLSLLDLVHERPISPSRDIVREIACTGVYNYKTIEAIEDMDDERKKRERRNQSQICNRTSQGKKRAASPSLLDESGIFTDVSMKIPAGTTSKNIANEDDDCVMIIEETQPSTSQTRSQKRPLNIEDDVIVLDSDSDGEDPAKKSKVELYPNPLYKKPKLMTKESTKYAATTAPLPPTTQTLAIGTIKASTSSVISRKEQDWADFLSKGFLPEPGDFQTANKETRDALKDLCIASMSLTPEPDLDELWQDLPPINNFSKGMSELPLQQEATEASGRMNRVLSIIRNKKKETTLTKFQDDDDDIEIIE